MNSQVNVMMMMMLSGYYLPILLYFSVYSELRAESSQDNGDKCLSVNIMKLDELTRISHQFIEGSSQYDQCFLFVSCVSVCLCTVRIFYKPQISDQRSRLEPRTLCGVEWW